MTEFWMALRAGQDISQPDPSAGGLPLRACLFHGSRPETSRALLNNKIMTAFAAMSGDIDRSQSLGVIFTSTKGMVNDFIWDENAAQMDDPLTPLLNDFLQRSELRTERALCVSNACSGALAAMALAQRWLNRGLEQVLIVAADAVTPFVSKGFQALKLMSSGGMKPFAANRSGFYLGEAAACLLFTRRPSPNAIYLRGVGLDGEGSAVTRPSVSGDSVVRAALAVPGFLDSPPEIIIAHGTGTVINDATEDLAFARIFSERENRPLITGTKWCVGHTLAVSGALDAIAACEALRRQELFSLATTPEADPNFKNRYATQGKDLPRKFSRVAISSLGFGGLHASCLFESEPWQDNR